MVWRLVGATVKCLGVGLTLAILLLFYPPILVLEGHPELVIDRDTVPKIWRLSHDGRGREVWGSGSGIVVAPGVVLTAKHVVKDASQYVVVEFSGGEKVTPHVECVSGEERDFAVMTVSVPRPAHDHWLPINDAPVTLADTLTLAGWPRGRFQTFAARLLLVEHNVRVGGEEGSVVFPEVVWVSQPNEEVGYQGFSGGPVFDQDGALRGFICCVHPVMGKVGFVPIRWGLQVCPLR